MDKTLSEVFPRLVTDDKKRIYDDTLVKKVAVSNSRNMVRVYTEFPGIVSKRRIKKLEELIYNNYRNDYRKLRWQERDLRRNG